MFKVTKTFGHDRGLSACFRQWRSSHSHCRWLHGYSLSVQMVFGAFTLDERQWVIDFGGFAEIKRFLEDTFDHKVVVAEDDPAKDEIAALAGLDAADVRILPAVGCEQFAKYVHDTVATWLEGRPDRGRVFLLEVTIAEHGSNSATYTDTALLGEPMLSELMRSQEGELIREARKETGVA
jgi:6-pyruvoyltetrahydropterin/6-carboxytetrahydropterin synthase